MMLVVLHFILLHTVDGNEVAINPVMITSMHAAKEDQDNKLFTGDVRCVVGLADGKFVSAVEKCSAVKQLLEDDK